jgi:hypothetical protein
MARKCNLSDAQVELKSLSASWDQCLGCLRRYRGVSSIARKSFNLLSVGAERLMGPAYQQNTAQELDNLPGTEPGRAAVSGAGNQLDMPAQDQDLRGSTISRVQHSGINPSVCDESALGTAGQNSAMRYNMCGRGPPVAMQTFDDALLQNEILSTGWARMDDMWNGDMDLGTGMPYMSMPSELEPWMFNDQSLEF